MWWWVWYRISITIYKKKVIGYDIDAKTISITKSFFKKSSVFFTPDIGDIERNTYELVIMFQVIEHFTNKYMHEILKSISKDLLKKDGIFICSTPNKLVTSPGLKKPVMVFHNFEFTPSSFKHVLEKHFKKVTILGQLETSGSLKPKKHQMRRVYMTRWLSQIELVRMIARHLPIKLKYLFMGNLIKDTRTYVLAKTEKDIKNSFTLIAVCQN
ncbi:hypothetical protein BH11PAT1_BH11PAT1_2500 [soil metagenome]